MNKYKYKTLKALLTALKGGSCAKDAIKMAGITEPCYYGWLKRKPKFAIAVDKVKVSQIKVIDDILYKKAANGDVRAIKLYFQRLGLLKDGTNVNVTAQATANAESKTEVSVDPRDAEARIKKDLGLLKRHGYLDEEPCEN